MNLDEINQKLKAIAKEKIKHLPIESIVTDNPFELFLIWFNLAMDRAHSDPSAMILATVDEQGYPDTRMVLLKELAYQRFIFYTSYSSKKAKDLAHQPVAALNFYWPDLLYQIRIRGPVEKLSREKNEKYFSSRDRGSQLSAAAWTQSSVIESEAELEQRIQVQEQKYGDQTVLCPSNWGGYALTPFEYEFFQRRKWRRHERLLYRLIDSQWQMSRLAP